VNPTEYRAQVEAELKKTQGSGTPAAGVAAQQQQAQSDWARDLEVLKNTAANPRDREAALWHLQTGSFLAGQFEPHRPGFIQALQLATTDPDGGLRRAALDILANAKDDFARRKLEEGLDDPAKALVSPAVALGFLARNDHASAARFARSYLSGDSDPATRAQAARVLASDPESKSLLAERVRDKNEFREVRRASAVALHNLDPDHFRSLAENILADASDFPEIKATVRGALERDEQPA
jgi:hypothetical protein